MSKKILYVIAAIAVVLLSVAITVSVILVRQNRELREQPKEYTSVSQVESHTPETTETSTTTEDAAEEVKTAEEIAIEYGQTKGYTSATGVSSDKWLWIIYDTDEYVRINRDTLEITQLNMDEFWNTKKDLVKSGSFVPTVYFSVYGNIPTEITAIPEMNESDEKFDLLKSSEAWQRFTVSEYFSGVPDDVSVESDGEYYYYYFTGNDCYVSCRVEPDNYVVIFIEDDRGQPFADFASQE